MISKQRYIQLALRNRRKKQTRVANLIVLECKTVTGGLNEYFTIPKKPDR